MSDWILVESQLPNHKKIVIIAGIEILSGKDFPFVHFAYWDNVKKSWYDTNKLPITDLVTHWQKFPRHPDE